jgi:hypothetical protein
MNRWLWLIAGLIGLHFIPVSPSPFPTCTVHLDPVTGLWFDVCATP